MPADSSKLTRTKNYRKYTRRNYKKLVSPAWVFLQSRANVGLLFYDIDLRILRCYGDHVYRAIREHPTHTPYIMFGVICSDRWSVTGKVADTFFLLYSSGMIVQWSRDQHTSWTVTTWVTTQRLSLTLKSVGRVKCAAQEKTWTLTFNEETLWVWRLNLNEIFILTVKY